MDYKELRAAVRYLGADVDDRDAVALLQQYDLNGDGLMDLREFTNLVRQLQRGGSSIWCWPTSHGKSNGGFERLHEYSSTWMDSEIRAAFRRYDANNSGKMDYRELQGALRGMGISSDSREATRLLREYDRSGDGAIDYPEFMKLYGPVPSLAEEDAYVQTYLRQKEDIKRDEDKVARADIVARRRQMTAEMMSKVLSAKMTLQFARVRGAFRHHDENQDGTVDQRGFKAVLNSLNLEGIDSSGDGAAAGRVHDAAQGRTERRDERLDLAQAHGLAAV